MQALHTLRRAFLVLIKRGDVRRPPNQSAPSDSSAKRPRVEKETPAAAEPAGEAEAEAEAAALRVFQRWAYEQYQAYVTALLGLLGAEGKERTITARVRVAALRTLMELVKVEGSTYRRPRRGFGHDLFGRVVKRLVQGSMDGEAVAVLKVDYVEPFFDVRYWLLRSLRGLAVAVSDEKGGKGQAQTTVAAIFKLLMLVTVPATEAEMLSFFVPFVEEAEADAAVGGGEGTEGEEEELGGDDDDLGFFDFGDDDGEAAGEEVPRAKDKGRRPSSVPLVAQLSAHRQALGEAWVACLKKLELTPALFRSTTQFAARHVLDAMPNPLQVSE